MVNKVLTRTDYAAGSTVGPVTENSNVTITPVALEINGYLTMDQVEDPEPESLKGILYVKQIDGYNDLHYMDEYGKGGRLTVDGYNYVKLASPNGKRFRIVVDDSGTLSTEEL